MTDRFPDAVLALAQLPAPAVIRTVDYEAIRTARIADFKARMLAAGINYDVDVLETDPGVVLQEEGAYREILNLAAINDAARAVMILYAQKGDQDVLYALLGIRRLTLVPADPTTTPPTAAVMESDDDFRARAQIALEGTAPGLTGGGYASIALRAAPTVSRVALVRQPGGVVRVVLQGRSNNQGVTTIVTNSDGSMTATWSADVTTPNNDGSVSNTVVQAVASALNDDWSPDPSTGSQLTDLPMVSSAVPLPYDIVARATAPRGPSIAAVLTQSLTQLIAAVQSLRIVNGDVPTDALIAAARVSPMTKFYLDSPAADVAPASGQIALPRSISLTVSFNDA